MSDSDNENKQDNGNPNTPTPPRFWGRPENDDQLQQPAESSPETHTPPPWEPPAQEPPASEPPPFMPPGYEPPPSFPPPGAGATPESGSQFPPPFTPPVGDPGTGQPFSTPFQAPDHKFAGRALDLRPLTVADILDNTFYLMRKHWKQLGIASLVYAVPAGAIEALQRAATTNGDGRFLSGSSSFSALTNITNTSTDVSGGRLAIAAVCTVLLIVLAVVLQPLVQGAVTRQVAAAYLNREMTAKEAFKGVRKLWWRFVGATFMVGLATIGGAIGFLIGAVVVAILFSVVIPVIAVEEETVFDAMGRSWALMKRRFWTYLAVRIMMGIIGTFVSIGVVLVPGAVALVLFKVGLGPLAIVVGSLGSVVAEVVVFPIGAITATLIYFDARVRFEAFDVQLMSSRLPQAPISSNAPADYGPGSV